MLEPPSRNLRVLHVALPDRPDLIRWLTDGALASAAQTLKADTRCEVLAAHFEGQPLVVKTWRLDRPRDLLNRFAHRTQALRHARAARTLAEAGVPCAPALLVLRGRGRDSRAIRETLVMPRIPGRSLLAHMRDHARAAPADSDGVARDLCDRVGRLVRTLASRALFNRDGKPSNIIVGPDRELTVIDAVGLRRAPAREALERMLFSLIAEPAACGYPPSPALRARTLRAATPGWTPAQRRELRSAIDARIRAHPIRTPAIDPLAPEDAAQSPRTRPTA